MKFIFVPLGKNATRVLSIFYYFASILVFIIGVKMILGKILNQNIPFEIDWVLFIPGILFMILGFLMVFQGYVFIPKELIKVDEYSSFENVTDQGFVLEQKGNDRSYDWSHLRSVKIKSLEDEVLTLVFSDYTQTDVSVLTGFYSFLKRVPSHKFMQQSDLNQRDHLFSNLSTCEVCGFIAVFEQECLNCRTSLYDPDDEDYSSKEEYIREEQLWWFSTDEPDEQVDFFPEEDEFARDQDWSPVISKQEILAYSKKHNWDKA